MGLKTALFNRKHLQNPLILLAVLIALIPAGWSFQGQWLSDSLLDFLQWFYIISGLCVLAVLLLVWLARPSVPDWIRSPPTSIPASGVEGKPGAGIIPRNTVNLYIWFSALGFAFSLVVAILTRRAPGIELLVFTLIYWLGWSLREGLLEKVQACWNQHRRWISAFGLFTLAVILGIFFFNQVAGFAWYVWLLVGLLGIPLWRIRRDVPFSAWLFLGALILYSFRLDHWLYAVVGDDYGFYITAREILNMPFQDANDRLFDCCMVYGMHPFISSLIQTGWMAIFGTSNYGWRGLNPLLCAVSLPFYFVFFRAFVSRKIAMTTVILLAASSYLMDFVKIGYNNPQAFWGMGMVLAACVWALQKPNGATYTGLGLAASLCLYLYPPSLYALPVAGLVMLFYAPPVNRQRMTHWALAGGLFLLFAALLFFNPAFIEMRLIGTFAWSDTLRTEPGALFIHTGRNLAMALLSGYYTPEESHFVVAGYQDPLSAALSFLGLAVMLTQIRRGRFYVFLTITFLLLLYLVGASHDRSTPSTTRMFIMLPWFSLFAAMGLEWLVGLFRNKSFIRFAVLAAIVMVNLVQAYWLALVRDNDNQSLEVLFVRLAQDLARKVPQPGRGYIFITTESHGIDGFFLFQDVYPQFLGDTRLKSIFIDQEGFEWVKSLGVDAKNLLIETPYLDLMQSHETKEVLTAAGWQACRQLTYNGQARFTIWYAPDPRYPAGPCSPVRRPLPLTVIWLVVLILAVLIDLGCILLLRRRARFRAALDKVVGV